MARERQLRSLGLFSQIVATPSTFSTKVLGLSSDEIEVAKICNLCMAQFILKYSIKTFYLKPENNSTSIHHRKAQMKLTNKQLCLKVKWKVTKQEYLQILVFINTFDKNYFRMNTIREQVENLDELPQQQLKIISQHTTKFCFTQTSPNSPPFDLESHIPTSSDTSFEQSMHLDNLEVVRVAADNFLESCLQQKYNKAEGFKDSSLYQVPAFQFKGENELENITVHNELLNQNMTKQLLAILEKEEGLIGFLKQIPQNFGITVAKELVYVIWHILHHKIEQFRQLTTIQEPIIPKMPCFQQCEQDILCQLATSCPVYEDINIEEITSFSEKDINNCANELFFGDIKILNLKEVTCQCKKGVNVIEKFSKFVSQISRAVFLTLIGATEPSQGIYGLSLSRQISLAELSEGGLSNQRSFSRPLAPCEDEQSYDFISKKIKFD